MPHNCVLLVDTFNSIEGVRHAIKIGHQLRAEGANLIGIRLDSGDMADLSIKARKLLDDAGFHDAIILASNSLDEYVIEHLKQKNAKISSWGVGTHLATAYDHPALDGVYKLSALRDKKGEWVYKLKLSEQAVKISNPGRLQVRRFFCHDQYTIDVMYDTFLGISDVPEAVLLDESRQIKRLDDYDASVDLLKPIFKQGKLILENESIHDIRKRAMAESTLFYRTHGENNYPVALEKNLYELKEDLIRKIKASS